MQSLIPHLTHISTHKNIKTEPKEKTKYEDVPLTVTIDDNCDDHPEVTITVYSDEAALTSHKDQSAILYRKYTPDTGNGALVDGWGVDLYRFNYAQKACGVDFACEDVNGRFYIVKVCAKDAAGWVTCDEDSVGVPIKPATAKHFTPDNEGKLFIVAEDTVFWKTAVDQFPFRAENTDLNVPAEDQGRLCFSDRVGFNEFDTFSPVASRFECARLCRENSGEGSCDAYAYQLDNGECRLYDQTSGVTSNTFSLWGYYVMGDLPCPGIDWP